MQQFSLSPREMGVSLWRHRELIGALIRREVVGRYRGSAMGMLWSFFHPLLMLLIYTFVFSVVFKTRWSTGGDSQGEFALVLFAGLMVFNLFGECINRAPELILYNANYVKKVVFPLEVLPWVALGSALFHMLVSFGVWLLFYVLILGLPHPAALLFPLTLLPLLLLTMGLSWILASLGVYLRDIKQITGVATTALLFLCPIFYPMSALPEAYRPLLELNPVALGIELSRNALIWGIAPNYRILIAYFLLCALFAWIGFAWFQKTRKGFADVL